MYIRLPYNKLSVELCAEYSKVPLLYTCNKHIRVELCEEYSKVSLLYTCNKHSCRIVWGIQ